ncbi:MAG: AAA family ATPase [Lachnospiraceae bacterium]|nr:AAA family ATPase [Lachnospiraceae bacterium]
MMQLISCYVENFGRLHRKEFTFTEGLNVVFEDNGWGKSTLGAFLLVMFYGFDKKEGKRYNELEDERKRYRPWQGGAYGGRVTFRKAERTYVLTRSFGEKRSGDVFELREASTNLVSGDFDEDIGLRIFGIDRESFLKTVFIGQNECSKVETTGDINAMISGLTGMNDDINAFEEADAALAEGIKRLSPDKKKGLVYRLEDDISGLEKHVRNSAHLEDTLQELRKLRDHEASGLEELKTLREQNHHEIRRLEELQPVFACRDRWKDFAQEADRQAEEARKMRERFPQRVPAMAELEEITEQCEELNTLKGKLDSAEFTQEEKAAYEALNKVFSGHIPEEEDFDKAIMTACSCRDVLSEMRVRALSSRKLQRLEALRPVYSGKELSEPLLRMENLWEERCQKLRTLYMDEEELSDLQKELRRKQASPFASILMIPGFLFLLGAGASFIFHIYEAYTLYAAAVGGFFLLTGILMRLIRVSSGKRKLMTDQKEIREEIEGIRSRIKDIEDTLQSFLAAYEKKYREDYVPSELKCIAGELEEYRDLEKAAQEAADPALLQEAEGLELELAQFFQTMSLPLPAENEWLDRIYRLQNSAGQLKALQQKKAVFRETESLLQDKYNNYAAFFASLGIPMRETPTRTLTYVRDMTDDYLDALRDLTRAAEKRDQFLEENRDILSKLPEDADQMPSREELRTRDTWLEDQIRESRKRRDGYEKRMEEILEALDDRREDEERIVVLKEELEAAKRKLVQLTLSRQMLRDAQKALIADYKDPILEGFRKYYSMLTGEDTQDFRLDAGAKLSLEAYGRQRMIGALSSGYKDLAGLCLRMALVDAMYPKEKPVLILDDPFTNLDDEKTRKGLEFLEKAEERYQILYFTCSSVRS